MSTLISRGFFLLNKLCFRERVFYGMLEERHKIFPFFSEEKVKCLKLFFFFLMIKVLVWLTVCEKVKIRVQTSFRLCYLSYMK